jgi:hypothetical protein
MFSEVVVLDFEFEIAPGERPSPVCCVAFELISGRRFRLMRDEMPASPPWADGPSVLTVAYYASAEISCYLELDWKPPERLLDLFVEFRNAANGLPTPAGYSLLGALAYHGLDGIGAETKRELQEAIGDGTWKDKFSAETVMSYCEQDARALARLLPVMLPRINIAQALWRGRYMSAAGQIECNGIPLDLPLLRRLREAWPHIQDQLIAEIDQDYHCYEGRAFKAAAFEAYLVRTGIPWPSLPTGRLDLSDGTFRSQAKAFPAVWALRELRAALSDLRLNDLAVGADGRNRCMLSAFRSRTGRNQPSNSRFVFGPSTWIRGLIRPEPGQVLFYADWAQQEFGIGAALSGDANMMRAYKSGDCYLSFAKMAGAVPEGATKETHQAERELYKQTTFATAYGMQAEGLALRIGKPPIVARDLLHRHRTTFRDFWRWSDGALDTAMLTGELSTVFGWTLHVGTDPNPRSIRNFAAQANAAEMMRVAAIKGIEAGVEIAAPVHDAFLVVSSVDRIEADIATMRKAMAEASAAVLGGFVLESECKTVQWPARYSDPRGRTMWKRVMALLDQVDAARKIVA